MRRSLPTIQVLFAVGTIMALALAGPARAAAEDAIDADLLLAGGTIYDGSGAAPVVGDVAIRDGRIVAVGTFAVGKVRQTIDCQGLAVAPGFIDLHNHSDSGIVAPLTRANINFLTQGCTTIVTGNCGSGPTDVGEYFEKIETNGAGTNVIHLLPHGALRSRVMGRVSREPTADELAKMRQIADQAMRDGAWGMSTGLIYVPGTYAKTDELVELCKIVHAYGGIYASHIRNEGVQLLDAVREALQIGQQSGAPVHVSHFKASGINAWGSLKVAAKLIQDARDAGQVVTADQYPYIASSTSLEATLFPAWSREGGPAALTKRLADPDLAEKIRVEVEKKLRDGGHIQVARYSPRPDWVGKSLANIASSEGAAPIELALEIQRNGGASIVNFGMHEDDVRFAMTLPWVATASDGSAQIPSSTKPHPRSFGTFTRKLGNYAVRERVLPLEQAVRSGSGLPADILNLPDRGYLRSGQAADVVVFDPQDVIDQATFESPFQYSLGIRHVLVNGQPALFDGVPTGALAGQVLRRPTKSDVAQ